MNAQGVLDLKPRGIGELFDLAIRLYRKNFFKFIGIIALAQIPVQLISVIVSVLTFAPAIQDLSTMGYDPSGERSLALIGQMAGGMVGSLLVGLLSIILVQGVAGSALTRSITDSYLGIESGVWDAYEKIKDTWLPLVLSMLALLLINFGFMIWGLVPCIGWLSALGLVMFFSMVISPLLAPIVVIERRTGFEAVRRAWDLTRVRFWWIIGFISLLYLFNILVVSGPVALFNSILSNLFLQNMDNTSAVFTAQIVSQSVVGLLLTLLVQPLQSVCAALVYFDMRVRQEGFDLALMAQQTAETPVSVDEAVRMAPVASSQSLITWPEFGNFIAFSFLAVIVYVMPLMLISSLASLIAPSF